MTEIDTDAAGSHRQPIGTAPRAWTTPLTGLTDAEVADRISRRQANDARQGVSRPLRDIIRTNIITPFNGLLGALAVAVLTTGYWQDALFGLVLVFNSLVGIIQELRAKYTLDRLAVLSAPLALVVRMGAEAEIATSAIVLDDLLRLRAGGQVPADGILATVDGLEIDESLLTGESEPVAKQPGDPVLSGSIVVAGSGRCQVTGVGADSFASQLTAEARRFTTTKSELVIGINNILKCVAVAVAVIGPLLYVSQARATAGWKEAVRGTVAGLVGMVPEGLVLLTSIAFFAAALKLARRRVLVRELPAVEGLARVDVMCLDKTGTLTEGDIAFDQVEHLGTDKSGAATALVALAALAALDDANATLMAVREAFPSPPTWERTASVAFSSARKWSAASFADHGTWVMGAPEMVRPKAPPDDPVRARADKLAAAGARTLLLAHGAQPIEGESLPGGLRPVALLTFAEKVRTDAHQTLRYFEEQGVILKVISGDSPQTVSAVAARVGLHQADTPVDLRQFPESVDGLGDLMEDRTVFGRVTPHQKRAMIAALQSRGHVVAMTGDGVNDALALKDADIGIAMGSGAPATRAVAQLVLLDSQFSVMPGVVAEGRRVIANIERVANLFLTKNVTSVVLALSVAVARWPFPFLPRHLTLVSELTIGIPGFFLALGPNPRRFEPGFVRRVLAFAVPTGSISAIAVLVGYGVGRANGVPPPQARTAATIIFTMISMWVLVIQARPVRAWKVILVAAMGGLSVLAFVIPFGRTFYDLHLPSASVTAQSIALGAAAAFVIELVDRFVTHRRSR